MTHHQLKMKNNISQPKKPKRCAKTTFAIIIVGLVTYFAGTLYFSHHTENPMSNTVAAENNHDISLQIEDKKNAGIEGESQKDKSITLAKTTISEQKAKSKGELLFEMPGIEVISDQQLRTAIEKLGNQPRHLFIGILLGSSEGERSHYLQLLRKLAPDSLERVEMELHVDRASNLSLTDIEDMLSKHPRHIGLHKLHIERLLEGAKIKEAMEELRHSQNTSLPNLWDQVSRATTELYSEAGLSDQSARESAAGGLFVYSMVKNTISDLYKTVGDESPDQLENPLGSQVHAMYPPAERALLIENLAHLTDAYGDIISSSMSNSLRIRAYKLRHNGQEPSADHPLMQKERCRVQIIRNSILDLDRSGHYSDIANWESALRLGEQNAILSNPSLAPDLTPSCRKILLQR